MNGKLEWKFHSNEKTGRIDCSSLPTALGCLAVGFHRGPMTSYRPVTTGPTDCCAYICTLGISAPKWPCLKAKVYNLPAARQVNC